MDRKCRLLWIEDGALGECKDLTAPLFMDGGYDLTVAETVSDAIMSLEQSEYDVVIVDIRLDPGDRQEWIQAFEDAGRDKIAARLGLRLLQAVFTPGEASVQLEARVIEKIGKWLSRDRIGLLTVETLPELDNDLRKLGLSSAVHRRKGTEAPRSVLLDLTKAVLQQCKQAHLGLRPTGGGNVGC